METNELRPCPFCGGWAELVIESDEDGDEYYCVECQECFASTDGHFTCEANSKKRSIDRWNRRVSDGTA